MHTILLTAYLWAGLSVEVRPKCGKNLAGSFWPPAANVNATVRTQAARCGELSYCARDVWRYRWEKVTVAYWKLAGQEVPPACRGAY